MNLSRLTEKTSNKTRPMRMPSVPVRIRASARKGKKEIVVLLYTIIDKKPSASIPGDSIR